jgi:hypothetical protein
MTNRAILPTAVRSRRPVSAKLTAAAAAAIVVDPAIAGQPEVGPRKRGATIAGRPDAIVAASV